MLIRVHAAKNAAHRQGASPLYCRICGKPILVARNEKNRKPWEAGNSMPNVHPKCLKGGQTRRSK